MTGGAGFIGSHIVDAYLGAGHEVTVVDDLSTGRCQNLNPHARYYELDVQDPQLREVFAQERPAVLNHHAAQMNVRRSVAEPMLDAQVNIVGLLNLMECGRSYGLQRVIFASSGGTVYGEQTALPLRETHATEPISPYGVAKLASERYLYYYRHAYGIRYVALRYANIYGPRQDPYGEAGVVAIFTGQLLRGDVPVINGTGRQTRDYVFVADVVQANLLALRTDYCGALNIGTGVETDVNQLSTILRRRTNSDTSARHAPPKRGEPNRSALDPSRAHSVLGWTPLVCLEDGLAQTVRYFRALGVEH